MSEQPRLAGAVDVHAHFLPPGYREACEAAGQSTPDGTPALPEWSPEAALELMDHVGVRSAMLSISSPGVHFGDPSAAVTLARSVNEAGAALVRANTSRFGLLASLPLPEIDSALAELELAYDELRCDGVALLTNYHGAYLS
ncbi:MAG: amidohydrolase family protein, partial [Acidobacteriota bacterium]|nr:amidohydrolase family protein [Acidobacteriota bacterium]